MGNFVVLNLHCYLLSQKYRNACGGLVEMLIESIKRISSRLYIWTVNFPCLVSKMTHSDNLTVFWMVCSQMISCSFRSFRSSTCVLFYNSLPLLVFPVSKSLHNYVILRIRNILEKKHCWLWKPQCCVVQLFFWEKKSKNISWSIHMCNQKIN